MWRFTGMGMLTASTGNPTGAVAHRRRFRLGIGTLLGLAVLIGVGALLWHRGAEFYGLKVGDRVDHPDFRTLSPGEVVGHGYGIFGTLLILTNLTYLLRRRWARLRVGSLRAWLDMHVFTGMLGSVLVLFHSAFQVRSAIAFLTSASLLAVVLSGLVGRYLYALTPAVDAKRFARDLAELDRLLPGADDYVRRQLAALPQPELASRPGLMAALGNIPSWRTSLERRSQVFAAVLKAADERPLRRGERRLIRRQVRRVERHARQVVHTALSDQLLRAWRGLHRFMAILMVLSVSVHIAVAWYFGFRWVFEP